MTSPTYPNQFSSTSDTSATIFLTGNQKKGYEDLDESGGCCSSGCCKSWSKKKICCVSCLGCILTVILVLAGLFLSVYLAPMKSQDEGKWETLLSGGSTRNINIDGNYELVSFSESYPDFLTAMGVPWFVMPIILQASEKLEFEVLEDGARTKTDTGVIVQEHFYKWDKWWSMEYGRGMGTMWNFCSRKAANVVQCNCEEREKDWKITSTLTFYEKGLINTRTFHNQNITAKKYYTKEGAIFDGELPMKTTTEAFEPIDIFAEEDDDDWEWDWNDE